MVVQTVFPVSTPGDQLNLDQVDLLKIYFSVFSDTKIYGTHNRLCSVCFLAQIYIGPNKRLCSVESTHQSLLHTESSSYTVWRRSDIRIATLAKRLNLAKNPLHIIKKVKPQDGNRFHFAKNQQPPQMHLHVLTF